jgi:thiamine biosynthesis protein ThiS
MKTIRQATNVDELLQELGYERQSVAVASDGNFLPKQQYKTLILKDDMELEVLVPMQGG